MGLKRRWEIILNKFNKDKGKNYDFRDIEIKLQRNIPSDETTMTSNALKLKGFLSDETVIDLLPQDLDPKSEIAKMKKQNEENIQDNLKTMVMMGQNTDSTQQNEKQGNKQHEVTDINNNSNIKTDKLKQNNVINKSKAE